MKYYSIGNPTCTCFESVISDDGNACNRCGADLPEQAKTTDPSLVSASNPHGFVTQIEATLELPQQDTRSTQKPTKGDQEIATPHQPQRGGNT